MLSSMKATLSSNFAEAKVGQRFSEAEVIAPKNEDESCVPTTVQKPYLHIFTNAQNKFT